MIHAKIAMIHMDMNIQKGSSKNQSKFIKIHVRFDQHIYDLIVCIAFLHDITDHKYLTDDKIKQEMKIYYYPILRKMILV